MRVGGGDVVSMTPEERVAFGKEAERALNGIDPRDILMTMQEVAVEMATDPHFTATPTRVTRPDAGGAS